MYLTTHKERILERIQWPGLEDHHSARAELFVFKARHFAEQAGRALNVVRRFLTVPFLDAFEQVQEADGLRERVAARVPIATAEEALRVVPEERRPVCEARPVVVLLDVLDRVDKRPADTRRHRTERRVAHEVRGRALFGALIGLQRGVLLAGVDPVLPQALTNSPPEPDVLLDVRENLVAVRFVDPDAHQREACGDRELLEGCVHFYRRRAARKGEPKKTHRRPRSTSKTQPNAAACHVPDMRRRSTRRQVPKKRGPRTAPEARSASPPALPLCIRKKSEKEIARRRVVCASVCETWSDAREGGKKMDETRADTNGIRKMGTV